MASSSSTSHGPQAAPSSSSLPPYSFATHLLGAFGAAKKKNSHTLKMLEELATLVKNRTNVEEAYAQQLTKMVANHNHALLRLGESLARKATGTGGGDETAAEAGLNTIDSTFRDCIERFKADALNKAEQRKQLALSISMEVFAPIEDMYNRLAAQSKDLDDKTAGLGKEAKGLEARYRAAHKKYEAAVQQATLTGNALVDQGGTMPTIDLQALYRKHAATPRDTTPPPSSPFDLKKEELSSLVAGSPKKLSAALTQVAKTDLTHWLLPAETNRQPDLRVTVQEHLELAELLRFACRDRYDDLVAFARQATHQLQAILCQYQLAEERCVTELTTVLQKQVVFESSCLANEQYEAQLIFKVIEAVDQDRDLEAFIQAHKAPHPGAADVPTVLKSLGLLASPLPLPPASLDDTAALDALTEGAMVLQTQDLPNLSSPAPSVVPAATVLRLLRGGGGSASRNHSPPLPSPIVSPVPNMAMASLLPALPMLVTPTTSTAVAVAPPAPALPSKSPLFFHHGTFVTPKQDMDDEDEDEDEETEDDGEEEEEEEEEDEGFSSSPRKVVAPAAVFDKRREPSPLIVFEEEAAHGAGKAEFIL